ncbi:unnamed protein product [Staurois parvus]|uniref:Secreted protein n=1 Tax=Staurois parvus TaxID=386267 RepID=A0ABN9C2U6_9NEOB|nr:unnamed protein product [Staurois parvus]
MSLTSLILPLLPVPPSPYKTYRVESLYTCSVWYFFSWESACDQHRVNPRCPDGGQGFCILLEQNENTSDKL